MLALLLAAVFAPKIVHVEPSRFGQIYVVDEDGQRYLRFGSATGDDQSVMALSSPQTVVLDYVRAALAATGYAEKLERVLMVGLGAGSFSSALVAKEPRVMLDVVEIDPAVVRVAERFFRLQRSERLRIHVDDGRRFLEQRPNDRWDVLFVDAYSGEGIPPHLTEASFFQLLTKRLTPGGVVVLNVAVEDDEEAVLLGRVRSAMPAMRCLRSSEGNLLVVAAPGKLPEHAAAQERAAKLGFPLAAAVQCPGA